MKKTALIDQIKELAGRKPPLTKEQMINQIMADLQEPYPSIAEFENGLEKNYGYKKIDKSTVEYNQRTLRANLAMQKIVETEVTHELEGGNPLDLPKPQKGVAGFSQRSMLALNRLFGKDEDFRQMLRGTPQEQGAYLMRKTKEALENAPFLKNPNISDQELVDNYEQLSNVYDLLMEVQNNPDLMRLQEGGEAFMNETALLQSNLAILDTRVFNIASPYYPAIDTEQFTHITFDMMDLPFDNDASDFINQLDTQYQNMGTNRTPSLEALTGAKNPGTHVEYFSLNGKNLDMNGGHLTAVGKGLPVLARVTAENGTVQVMGLQPLSKTSFEMQQNTPEELLRQYPAINSGAFFDLCVQMTESNSFFRGSSDNFRDMQAAAERVLNHNMNMGDLEFSSLNMSTSRDDLEELLESSRIYLKGKTDTYLSRAGNRNQTLDYSKIGKNSYEQNRIDIAVKLRDFAEERLRLYNLLEADTAFMARAETRETQISDIYRNNNIKMRAESADLIPKSWEIRENNYSLGQFHSVVARDLRSLATLASQGRQGSYDSVEKAELTQRVARVATLALVMNERRTSPGNEMGPLEKAVAADPRKFAQALGKTSQFQKMVKMDNNQLHGFLTKEGLTEFTNTLVKQAAQISAKTPQQSAPEKAPEIPKNGPQR